MPNFGQRPFSSTSQSEPRFASPYQYEPSLTPPPVTPTSTHPAQVFSPFEYVQRSLSSIYSGIPDPAIAMMSQQGTMFNSNSGQVGDFYSQPVYDYDASTKTWTALNRKNHVPAGDQRSKQNDPKQSSATPSTIPCSSSASATSAAAPKVNTSSFLDDPTDSTISSDFSSSAISIGSSSTNTTLESNSGTDTSLAAVDIEKISLQRDFLSTNVQSSDRDSLFALASVAISQDDTKSKEKTTNSNSSANSMNKIVNEAQSELEAMKSKLLMAKESTSTNQGNGAASLKTETSIPSSKEPNLIPLNTIEGQILQGVQLNRELKAQQSNATSQPAKSYTATEISSMLASLFVREEESRSATTTSTQPKTLHSNPLPANTSLPISQQSIGTNIPTLSPFSKGRPLNRQYWHEFLGSPFSFQQFQEMNKINEKAPKTKANPPTSSTTSFSHPLQTKSNLPQPPQTTKTNESSSQKIPQQNDEPLIDNQTPKHIREIILRAVRIRNYDGRDDNRSPAEFIEQFEMYAELLKLNGSQKRVLFIRKAYRGEKLYMKAMKSTLNYEQAVDEFLNMWAKKNAARRGPLSYAYLNNGFGSRTGPGPCLSRVPPSYYDDLAYDDEDYYDEEYDDEEYDDELYDYDPYYGM